MRILYITKIFYDDLGDTGVGVKEDFIIKVGLLPNLTSEDEEKLGTMHTQNLKIRFRSNKGYNPPRFNQADFVTLDLPVNFTIMNGVINKGDGHF